jgi:hypothetical protein
MGAPVRPASNSTTQKTHCLVKSTSNDLTAVGITTCLPSELTSSLRIGEFPCRLLRTKNPMFHEVGMARLAKAAIENSA